MIPWYWIPIAASAGTCVGALVMGVIAAGHAEDEALRRYVQMSDEGDELAERAESGHELIPHDDPRWTGALM